MDDPNSSAWQGHGDPNSPKIGTELTVRVKPGARKPGRKKKKPGTAMEQVDKVRKSIQRAHAREDFGRRTVELHQQGMLFGEIAVTMSEERGEVISLRTVINAYNAHVANVEITERSRNEEVMRLEVAAADIWKVMKDMDAGTGDNTFDPEVYVKVAETYLKYRERIAKLLGLDAAVKIEQKRDNNPGAGLAIDLDANGLHIRMPGSLDAFEEWTHLADLGLTKLAQDVIELEEGEHVEVGIDEAMFNEDREKAGLTLNPHADASGKADRAAAAIAALEALQQ